MKCIQFYSSLPSIHSQPKQNQRLIKTHDKLLNPCGQQLFSSTNLVKLGQRMSIRTSVITNPLILAETSPAHGGDISVLLQTGGLLLFVYGIANFVVPAFIFKDFEFEKETKESATENDDDEASKPKLQTKKRGFQDTRT